MPILGICPDCGHRFPLQQALADSEARQALQAALALPAPLAKQIPHYMSLLAPQGRAISMARLVRLLRELTELVTSGRVTRKRISHAAPLDLWVQGIEQTLAARDAGSLNLPLADHAYLTEIVWRLASKPRRGGFSRPSSRHGSGRPAADLPDPAKSDAAPPDSRAKLASLEQLYAYAPNAAIKAQIDTLKQQIAEQESLLSGEK